MIILDTNVVSAAMRSESIVVDWVDRQASSSVWTTAVNLFEIHLSLMVMPAGRRRAQIELALKHFIENDLEGRVLPFDLAAALEAARLSADRRAVGRPGESRDTMIAGIALAQRATLATRNVRHFADLRVPVVDPWSA
jgi:predicted nucleic acid-binding protein